MWPEAPPSSMPPLLKPRLSWPLENPPGLAGPASGRCGKVWDCCGGHLSWKPEWLLVQHTWLTLLEPEHCPTLGPTPGPTPTTTAGRCVGAALSWQCCPAASDTRHYCHPARLTCGPGSAFPPSHTAKEERDRERERAEPSRSAASLGPVHRPLQATPRARRVPPGNHPLPNEPVRSLWPAEDSERAPGSLDARAGGASHSGADGDFVAPKLHLSEAAS